MPTKELIAASSRPLVLSILADEGESYGYALIQRVKALSGGELEWTEGMLYPVLHRMERDGLVAARWGESETGRKRKYYRLTSPGEATLTEDRRQWTAVDNTLKSLWGRGVATAITDGCAPAQ